MKKTKPVKLECKDIPTLLAMIGVAIDENPLANEIDEITYRDAMTIKSVLAVLGYKVSFTRIDENNTFCLWYTTWGQDDE